MENPGKDSRVSATTWHSRTQGSRLLQEEGCRKNEYHHEYKQYEQYCYHCKKNGHFMRHCPNKKGKMADAFFVGMTLSAKEDDNLDDL